MAKIKNTRLSSDFLYTYTSKYENIELMLKFGLRHSLNIEKIPYKDSIQSNFIVCFCDILPGQADYHKSIYGNYALAFTKEWGIQNGVSPLRYIHRNSPGATANYVRIKNDMREARNAFHDGNQLDYFLSLLLFSTAREKGLFTKDKISDEINNLDLVKCMKSIDDSFADKKRKFGDPALSELFNEWVIPILHMLEKSVDELEKRDSFVRIYQDDFRDVKDKILYDEREWRSVKFITEQENNADPSVIKEAMKNRYLPLKYNLSFTLNDIAAVIVNSKEEKNKIQKYISTDLPHLKGLENRVMKFSEYKKVHKII